MRFVRQLALDADVPLVDPRRLEVEGRGVERQASDTGRRPAPPLRSCSRPHWSVELSTPGALAIMSNTMLPCGRS